MNENQEKDYILRVLYSYQEVHKHVDLMGFLDFERLYWKYHYELEGHALTTLDTTDVSKQLVTLTAKGRDFVQKGGYCFQALHRQGGLEN